MNGNPVADFDELQKKVVSLVGKGRGPTRWRTRRRSSSTATQPQIRQRRPRDHGRLRQVQDGQIVELIKKIKFTPPKAGK
jgi:hypothetical protein